MLPTYMGAIDADSQRCVMFVVRRQPTVERPAIHATLPVYAQPKSPPAHINQFESFSTAQQHHWKGPTMAGLACRTVVLARYVPGWAASQTKSRPCRLQHLPPSHATVLTDNSAVRPTAFTSAACQKMLDPRDVHPLGGAHDCNLST